jgi:hypothetical protein
MGSFTLALLEALLSAGVAPDRARTVVELFDRSVDERYGLHAQILATKRDLADVETRLTRDLAENSSRIAECNARIAESRADVIKWMLAALTAQTALLVGVVKLL